MSRWRAALIHLGISALVATVACAIILLLWYPGALFRASGGRDLLVLLVSVDVVLGPLLTLIVFKAGKQTLRFDLSVIAAMQLAALIYGATVVFLARPVFMAHNGDRFELIPANALTPEKLSVAPAPYRSLSLTGPVTVSTKMPADPTEQMNIMTTAVEGGDDLQHLPQHYVPLQESKVVLQKLGKPLDKLRELNADQKMEVDQLIARYPGAQVRYFPLKAKREDMAALVDVSSAQVLEVVPLKPW